MTDAAALVPVVVFIICGIGASLYVRANSARTPEGTSFAREYFIGGRSLGGFILAMTTVATYGSVSSFVGGPGQAWSIGFGWVYMAICQVTLFLLLFGIFGKKMALISRRIDAVTVIDVIRARYGSDLLAVLAAVVMVLFFLATMVSQFVGGANLFSAVTGSSYTFSLVLFAAAAIVFTVLGGFRGVAVTDALCGILMLVGIGVLAGGIMRAGGGFSNIISTISQNHPEMLSITSGGDMPPSLYFTQWLLVGAFAFVLPQSVVRTLGFKDTSALNRAMVIGTVIISIMMLSVTLLGVLAAGVLTEDISAYGSSVDNIIPYAIHQTLPTLLAGIAIIGPVAASISTVSSLLISSSSALIKDLWMTHAQRKSTELPARTISAASQLITLVFGIIVAVISLVPPNVIWKINMFAFGGLESAFFFVMVCGLFWKRANKTGAICSLVLGTLSYCITMGAGISIAGLHQIIIGIAAAGAGMLIGSLIGHHDASSELSAFFPKDLRQEK